MAALSPVVFARHAREFLEAAQRERAHARMLISLPAYFLFARSIELGLKSFLLLNGRNESHLRSIGHDLGTALDTALEVGISSVVTVSPESDAAVRWINAYYRSKDLEYPTTGFKSYPQLHYLEAFATQLLDALEPRLRQWRPPPE